MKILYLLRHAKSDWSNVELSDFQRPLSKRGKKDAPFMGKILANKKIKIDLMVSSPAKRAKKTAKKVAKQIAYSKEKIVFNEEIYEANIVDVLAVIHQTPDTINSLMLVGHNPTFTDLANLLCKDFHTENIPTAGIFAIAFPHKTWAEIEENTGNFLFFEYPKKYEQATQGQALSIY
ncbi:MAG: histidine phosphatase family protein [Raineya sp.]